MNNKINTIMIIWLFVLGLVGCNAVVDENIELTPTITEAVTPAPIDMSAYEGDCGVTVVMDIEKTESYMMDVSALISNTTEKNISKLHLYFVKCYDDKTIIDSIKYCDRLTAENIEANESRQAQWRVGGLDEAAREYRVFVGYVLFADGSKWGTEEQNYYAVVTRGIEADVYAYGQGIEESVELIDKQYIVWYTARVIQDNSVGDSWSYGMMNKEAFFASGETIMASLPENRGPKLTIFATEADSAKDDSGQEDVFLPNIAVGEEATIVEQVVVTENDGRYSGNKAYIEFTITISRPDDNKGQEVSEDASVNESSMSGNENSELSPSPKPETGLISNPTVTPEPNKSINDYAKVKEAAEGLCLKLSSEKLKYSGQISVNVLNATSVEVDYFIDKRIPEDEEYDLLAERDNLKNRFAEVFAEDFPEAIEVYITVYYDTFSEWCSISELRELSGNELLAFGMSASSLSAYLSGIGKGVYCFFTEGYVSHELKYFYDIPESFAEADNDAGVFDNVQMKKENGDWLFKVDDLVAAGLLNADFSFNESFEPEEYSKDLAKKPWEKEWITEDELSNLFGYSTTWMGEYLLLNKYDENGHQIKYKITGSPKSTFDKDVIYEGDREGLLVRFEYDSECNKICFIYLDLVDAGIIAK